ncbi:uncharacterized protein LOC143446046 [Clavelina lepadiformis]|uniref:uncharacterized protein LOC143446046 n=1 Tax=Clavelina lepadiformis TaxID=159417 RepID=UPI004041E201
MKKIDFFLLLFVIMLSEVNAQQCTGNESINQTFVSFEVTSADTVCSPYMRSLTRSLPGRTVVYLDISAAVGAECFVYEGTSVDIPLGQINDNRTFWIEIPTGVTVFTFQCFKIFQGFALAVQTVEFVTQEVNDLQTSITVTSLNHPANYPQNHLQETVLRSTVPAEYSISFNSPFALQSADWLYILSDGGTALAYTLLPPVPSSVPSPFFINGTEIKIRFSSNDDIQVIFGFSMNIAFVKDLPTTNPPTTEQELTCKPDGKAEIRISNASLVALSCSDGEDDLYVSPNLVEDLSELDPSCVANASNPNFDLYFNNLTSSCTTIQASNGTLFIELVVRCQQNFTTTAAIQRYESKCIKYECEYNLTEVTNSSAILPRIIKQSLDEVKGTGTILPKLIFTDETYSNESENNVVITVPNYVYSKVEITTAEVNFSFFLQVTQCWATQTEDSDSNPRYSIIHSSCPDINANEPSDAVEIDRNYQSNYAAFRFRSFVWTGAIDDDIYVHCQVTICYNSENNQCPSVPVCNKRRRRDWIPEKSQSQVVSSGPLRIRQSKKDTCYEQNGGCSDVCEMRIKDVICSCLEGRVLDIGRKICREKTFEVAEITKVEDQQAIILLGLVIVAIVVCITGFFIKWKRNNGKLVQNLI